MVLYLGDVKDGGNTLYYCGRSLKQGCLEKEIKFKHGQLQKVLNRILHAVDCWEGKRTLIKFNLKKDVFLHFYKYGDKFFRPYAKLGYPSKFQITKN